MNDRAKNAFAIGLSTRSDEPLQAAIGVKIGGWVHHKGRAAGTRQRKTRVGENLAQFSVDQGQ
jgi:hypothetical protein